MATPVRAVRMSDDLWGQVVLAAARLNVSPSAYVVQSVEGTFADAPAAKPKTGKRTLSDLKDAGEVVPASELALGPVRPAYGSMLKGRKS